MDWAREMTDSDETRLSLMVWLKCCQRLGRFPRLAEIPAQVIEHVRNELGLPEQVGMTDVAERTGRNHKTLVRSRLGLDGDQGLLLRSGSEPDDQGGQGDGTEEDVGAFVVACGHGPEVLQPVDCPFDCPSTVGEPSPVAAHQ